MCSAHYLELANFCTYRTGIVPCDFELTVAADYSALLEDKYCNSIVFLPCSETWAGLRPACITPVMLHASTVDVLWLMLFRVWHLRAHTLSRPKPDFQVQIRLRYFDMNCSQGKARRHEEIVKLQVYLARSTLTASMNTALRTRLSIRNTRLGRGTSRSPKFWSQVRCIHQTPCRRPAPPCRRP
ncbi:hypothetical protein K461DRAFT_137257 [Myriangium duriaei CBS 260.36]|uniref:Uncharacterized protein n=1 Tax=Myriangium duriaei CBS 260.36 TaxID=1168546 RepID=A0A9P4J2E0_9PEZI|nr:hypothetical protein K461DRAFT_137257 [Myriangium duriaei CBS 260.36]